MDWDEFTAYAFILYMAVPVVIYLIYILVRWIRRLTKKDGKGESGPVDGE